MPNEAQTPPGAPTVVPFGKYLLDAEIARGGMARVYRARLRGLAGFEKRLVVKQILPHLATDPRFVELFVREANVLVAMSHPGIVPVYELGVVDGVYFLAMEHVEGATLAELVSVGGPLPAALVAQIGAEVADALHYAHDRFGLVHRDVTPRNVIVDTTGHARLLDFGIAAKTEGTATTEIFGSHGYMSPEQLRGDTLSPASDVFSLGATLFEALAGTAAFHRADPAASRAALEGETPTLPPGAPDELARVVTASLARDAGERPRSASEVGRRLRGWLASERPEGVSEELAARVASTMASHAAMKEGPATSSLAAPASGKGEPSGVVRTLAQSKSLAALVDGTAPVSPTSGTAPAPLRTSGTAPVQSPPDKPPEGTVRVERKRTSPVPSAPDLASTRPGTAEVAARPARSWLVPVAVVAVAALGIAAMALGGGFGDAAATTPDAGVDAASSAALVSDSGAVDAGVAALGVDAGTGLAADAGPGPSPDDAAIANAPSPAFLTVSAQPWADVTLDGHALGTTPRRHLSITPGAHVLELVCEPLGHRARVPLRIVAGSSTSVVVDLTRDPPSIRVE